ncbi:hypothetical protein [Vibrio sp. OPT18]|uniref:hypothetical protein n=1 Tax=Vibrio sp. OPT18 TaxID=2778641 RepID=UPI001880338C|nr:hypothetical protein [Vibrio sp. OPT18]MBE8577952.1 hypothetical protein [Vibrio sp. OPT18]
MKNLSIADCNRDLTALDAADKLAASLHIEIEKLKEMDTSSLIKKASSMLFTGKISLEALGLPSNLLEQLEQFEKLNGVARKKLRDRINDDRTELLNMSEGVEVINVG